MRLRTFVLFAAILAWFGCDGARAQIAPPPSGGSACTPSGSPTSGYVLTATNNANPATCSWQTVGGASVDNNTLKNAAYIADLSGSANTISGTTATTFPGAYAAGQSVIVKVANTNTGATTININTLGAKAVTKNGNTALAAGNLVAGNDYLMTYDGTEFEVLTFTILAVDIPTLNQNTTGNAATATDLASYPTLCSGGQFSQGLSSGSNNCGTPSGGGGGTPGGTSGQVQYNNSGAFGGFTVSGDGTLNTSTGALAVTKINGTTPGNSCTNQAVTAISSSAVPTCTTLTSAYVNNSIALTGTDVNTSNQVTATHLSAALPVNQGGTGTTSTLTGLVRGSASAMTAAELSGDATTSGSNAVTVTKINGTALSGLATGIMKNTTSTGVPSIAAAGTDYIGPTTGSAVQKASSGGLTAAGASDIVGLFSTCSGTQYLGADGACHTAGGGVTPTASSFSSIGSCSTTAFLKLLTNSYYNFALCDGSSNLSYFMDGKQVYPPSSASNWTVVSGASGTASVADTNGAVTLSTSAAVLGVEAMLKTLPSTPYTKTIGIRYIANLGELTNGDNVGCGALVTNGTTASSAVDLGRWVTESSLGAASAMSLVLIGQSNTNFTWSGSSAGNVYYNSLTTMETAWWQIADNGTTRTIKFGVDGVNFPILLHSVSSTASPFNVTAPTKYGVFCGAQNTVTGSNPWSVSLISDN